MQFVAYDSDSDHDEVTTEPVNATESTAPALGSPKLQVTDGSAELPAEWLNADESSSDNGSVEDSHLSAQLNQAEMPTKRLADFNTLLSAVSEKPKFLQKKIDEDVFVVPEARSHNYDAADKDYSESRHQNRASTEGKRPAAVPTVRVPPSAVRVNSNSSREAGGGGNSKVPLGQDKETAKDRVKRQRLSGQAGIGSDFREWRSEEEMRQRQMYD